MRGEESEWKQMIRGDWREERREGGEGSEGEEVQGMEVGEKRGGEEGGM